MNPIVTVTGFWDAFVTKIAVFLPNLFFSVAILLLGWVICNVIKRIIVRVLKLCQFDLRWRLDVNLGEWWRSLDRLRLLNQRRVYHLLLLRDFHHRRDYGDVEQQNESCSLQAIAGCKRLPIAFLLKGTERKYLLLIHGACCTQPIWARPPAKRRSCSLGRCIHPL